MTSEASDTEISQEDIEKAKKRLTMAMAALFENPIDVELHLQHVHAALGGEKDELYREYNDE